MKSNNALRIFGNIFVFGFGGIVALISTIYLFTNARILFSGDFTIYALPVLGFFDTLFTFFTYACAIGFVVVSYLYLLKKGSISRYIYSILAIGFFVMSVIYFATNKLWPTNGIEGILIFINKVSLIFVSAGIVLIFISE